MRTIGITGIFDDFNPDGTDYISHSNDSFHPENSTYGFYSMVDGSLLAQFGDDAPNITKGYFFPDGKSVLLMGSTTVIERMWDPQQTQAYVYPDGYAIHLGKPGGGTLADLLVQDGNTMGVCKWLTPVPLGASVRVSFDAVSPFKSLTSLTLTCVASTDTAGGFNHVLEMWDWIQGRWDPVDTRTDPIGKTAQTYALTGTGDLSRFVNQTDRTMRCRTTLVRYGPAAAFTWCMRYDMVQWSVTR
ncbi:MAG: hypothetical protein JST30_09675 [Armatimonadetes bacterium]|nr:hypothetical protein [Armatimonadota bacterium]